MCCLLLKPRVPVDLGFCALKLTAFRNGKMEKWGKEVKLNF